MNLPVNIDRAIAVDFLINLSWGVDGSQVNTIIFRTTDGCAYTNRLTTGVNVRDWLQSVYVNAVDWNRTFQVFSSVSPESSHSGWPGRIDKYRVALPPEFATRTLASIVLIDEGITGNDNPTYCRSIGASRVFVAGVTVTSLRIP
jgi:hypothetical protein